MVYAILKTTPKSMTSQIKKIVFYILLSLIGLFGFYKFMTYDRNYTWTKELEEEVKITSKIYGFNIVKTNRIEIDDIKLPTERAIKIRIQKALNNLGLMNYGQEFGQTFLLNSVNTKQLINCKAWCLSDHVIGLEIEYKNIEKDCLNNIKQEFKKQFDNYKIVWTELLEK